MLGDDCEPDAEFFVRCWTEGAESAVEDLRLRSQRERERHSSSSWPFGSFLPSFSAEEFFEGRRMYATCASPVAAGLFANPGQDEDAGPCWEDDSGTNSFTVERARRLLGVAAGSTAAQIKGAYRRLVRMYHPDRLEGGSWQARQTATGRMMAINEAYRLLRSGRPN